jgi:hypothetical protein
MIRIAAPILLGKGNELMPAPWQHTSGKVFPVGDRFLCWVDYFYDSGSILVCDMAEVGQAAECPRLRLLPLPEVPLLIDLLPTWSNNQVGALIAP